MSARARRVIVIVLLSLVALLACDALLFRVGLYVPFLDPNSTAGAFETTFARVRATSDAPSEVLVLGDSRMNSGFSPEIARRAAGGIRFVNAAVPGTTPRCWRLFVRDLDLVSHHFRAVVIPVDTYADDATALGSLDAWDHIEDLRYVIFHVRFSDFRWFLRSIHSQPNRVEAVKWMLLRGRLLGLDVQAFLADPVGRFAELAAARSGTYVGAQGRRESLAGLHADFAHGVLTFPSRIPLDERSAIADNVLELAREDRSYGDYRREMLGDAIARLRAVHIPVVFVRIPTRPLARPGPPLPFAGSLASLARDGGVALLPEGPYRALERPELFADTDHLNVDGRARFSALLGRDVAEVVRSPAGASKFGPTTSAGIWPSCTGDCSHSTERRLARALSANPAPRAPLLFQTTQFALFFVFVTLCFYAVGFRRGKIVLLLASYFFYATWNGWYVAMLLGITTVDFVCALAIERATRQRRAILWLGIAANLAILGTLKYTNFALGTFAALFRLQGHVPVLELLVPLGISFHTFQSISYLADVYRGKMRAIREPLDYALYLAFFPQLLSGPIVRATLFFAQLAGWRRPTSDEVLDGVGSIVIGLLKKTVIADQFAITANTYFGAISAHPGAPAAWSGAFAFAMQIYFDFSGYTDIVIGLARVLGFAFPRNFARPYFATSLTDFWHRWNITLSTWLRDYVYIPLGGSRHGEAATVRNVMITMLLGGLWHGANWTFVVWGAYHGALLAIERLTGLRYLAARARTGTPRWFAHVVVTFVLVTVGWVFFRAPTFGEAFTVLRAMVAGGLGPSMLVPWQVALAAVALGWEAFVELRGVFAWHRLPAVAQAGGLAGLLLVLELLSRPGQSASFIYFKF